MWKTLRELSDRLVEYGSVSLRGDASLTDKLIETVDELRASAVTPERLDEVLAAVPTGSALHPKLNDLSMLYAAYDAALVDALDGKPSCGVASTFGGVGPVLRICRFKLDSVAEFGCAFRKFVFERRKEGG
jgi:hypothetical protein